jgi:chemotaxis protein MotB
MTFSDIITLLLTFFILIMTFSTIETEKLEKASGAFRGAFGAVGPKIMRPTPALEQRRIEVSERVEHQGAETARRKPPSKVAEVIHQLVEGDRIVLSRSDLHWRISLPKERAFAPGSGRPRSMVAHLYEEIAKLLGEYPNVVVVEGHTDDAFLPTAEHATAWDLGAARAAAVADILRRAGYPPEQIQIRTYGSSRPVVPNRTTLNRARNRRVDLLVLAAEEKGMTR